MNCHLTEKFVGNLLGNVADPDLQDPYVYGAPGSVYRTDLSVRDTDPDPDSARDPDPSIIKQKQKEKLLFCDFFMTFFL